MKINEKMETFSPLLSQQDEYREDIERALGLAIAIAGREVKSFDKNAPEYSGPIEELLGIHHSYLSNIFWKCYSPKVRQKDIKEASAAASSAAKALKRIPDTVQQYIRWRNNICGVSNLVPNPSEILAQLDQLAQMNRINPNVPRGAAEKAPRKKLIEDVYHFARDFFGVKIPRQGALAKGKNDDKVFVNTGLESVYLIAQTLEEDITRKNVSGALKSLKLNY